MGNKRKTEQTQKKKTMTSEDVTQFDELYRYVKMLFGYDDTVPLPSYVVLRLKGLRSGKFAENYNVISPGFINEFGDSGDVGYDVILGTIRLYADDISRGLSRNHIEDVKHKTNYLCKVVESHLQETVDLIKRNKKSQQAIDQSVDLSTLDADRVEYKKQDQLNNNPVLETLWK